MSMIMMMMMMIIVTIHNDINFACSTRLRR